MPAAATQVHLFCPCGFLSVSSTPNAPTTTRTKRNAHGGGVARVVRLIMSWKFICLFYCEGVLLWSCPDRGGLNAFHCLGDSAVRHCGWSSFRLWGGAHRCARMFNVARARIALYRRVGCSRVRWSNAQFFVCISLLFVFPCLFFGTTLSNNCVKLSISLLADWPHE